jgi:hypothetical protein
MVVITIKVTLNDEQYKELAERARLDRGISNYLGSPVMEQIADVLTWSDSEDDFTVNTTVTKRKDHTHKRRKT